MTTSRQTILVSTEKPHMICLVSYWDMITHAGLLDSQIFQTPRNLDRVRMPCDTANDASSLLLMGLQFFCPVSPSESPKFMGLTGIHHLDALHWFADVTFCPWCQKEGQNEGTIVNHLRATHYKLGLVCKKCFCCPHITLEAIWYHS